MVKGIKEWLWIFANCASYKSYEQPFSTAAIFNTSTLDLNPYSSMLYNFNSLLDILQYRSLEQPESTSYIFLQNGETESLRLTYGELDRRARAIAAHIQSMQGERALLLYPSGLEFIIAFFGCLYAGVVAVPVYPPRQNQKLSRLLSIVNDAQAKVALTTTSVLADIEKRWFEEAELAQVKLVATDTIETGEPEFISQPVTPQTLAFLQYTSGSTGTPKGVMVTHGNIIHNLLLICQAFNHSEKSIVVGWLPLFHDMGLIANVLEPIYVGFPSILMPPIAFLQKPICWLNAISNYRATTSGGPNFAYDLCVKKVETEELVDLDLSSWDVAFNGAEPIRAETLKQFAEKFASCSFNYRAFYPCYGMAETTLFATGGDKNQLPVIQSVLARELEQNSVVETEISSPLSRVLVGVGRPGMNTTVIIVNPESLTRSREGLVGEIWVSGDSITSGYWNRPEATQETFQAYLKDTGDGPFLRTGDLGFFRNGEFFVTGRLKDLIIIYGRNYYPQDIELTVENSHPALRSHCSAAFSTEVEDSECLVIACEVERTYLRKLNTLEIVRAIQIAVSTEHELEVYGVVLLKTGSIPKTSSGKIQRRACKLGFLDQSLNVVGQWQKTLQKNPTKIDSNSQLNSQDVSLQNPSKTVREIEVWLAKKIAEILQITSENIDLKQPLAVYGLTSVKAVSIAAELEKWLGISIAPTIVYDYASIQALADYLGQTTPADKSSTFVSNQKTATEAVAIIGMGCRFPKANNPQAFWSLLRSGVDAITKVPVSRWESGNGWGGFLEQVDQFDTQFFSISPREASNMDPQQRLLLEVSWEALENAGLPAERLAGSRGGVFIGISNGDYAKLNGNLINTEAYYGTGNALSIAANRLSYFLDWHGPSWAVDTACSSSLVAIHQACQSLLLGECNLALAGGVNLMLSSQLTLTFSEAQMMASDGRCKTFDVGADGYVRSEGCGVVVLKRLCDALADGDHIQAIIRGTAVNQDGLTNGLTAPNGNSQQEVIRLALAKAQVKPNQISYVETHGTGTVLGDPIEVNSLKATLVEDRESNQPCWIGSVKTNIGHLEAAAGIAGLIKVVLSLEHGEIPPHLHLKQLNPYIELDKTTIEIPTQLQPWSSVGQPRLAGVSAFGFGGTNAHVILEEAPVQFQIKNTFQEGLSPTKLNSVDLLERPVHLLTLSAKTEKALEDLVVSYQNYLEIHEEIAIADVCFNANTGRSHFNHRLAIISSDKQELTDKLAKISLGEEPSGIFSRNLSSNSKSPKIVFLFTGQGSQYVNMGKQLYETQPVFRRALDQCEQVLQSYLEKSLLEVIYPENLQELNSSLIDQTAYTQPALFAIEYALAQLWQSWGIKPDVVMGHSVGEYVAATVAGVFSLEDALKLIAHRGRLMQKLPSGGEMVAVMASEEKVNQLIAPYTEKVAIAAINGPESVVMSGEAEAIRALINSLELQGIKTKQLQVSHAFHSPLMEPILADFEAIANQITYNQPQIPLISNVTGSRADNSTATANYWVNHVRQPVKFAQSMETLHQEGYEVFLEIGTKPILLGMGRQCLPEGVGVWLPSLRSGQDDWQQMLHSLGELYVLGVKVDWLGFDRDYPRNKVVLPTYPFQRQRYWIETCGGDYPSSGGKTTTIVDWLNDGNTQQLAQQLEKVGKFSPEQVKFLPEILEILLKQHQEQLTAAAAIKNVKNWLYKVEWRSQVLFGKQLRARYLPSVSEIDIKLHPQVIELTKRPDLELYKQVLTQLETLSIEYVLKAFEELGWEFQEGKCLSTKLIVQQLGVVKEHQRLLERLLEMLSEVGILRLINGEWEITQVPDVKDPQKLLNSLLSQYPSASTELTLLKRCASQLASVLRGESDPVQLVFPEGDLTTATQLYQESPGAKVMNTLVQQAVLSALEQLPSYRGVRVLEIGAGTGGTSAHILPHLRLEQTEYVFTDISALFTSKAKEKFRDYPFIRYQTLDIEQNPFTQGFDPYQYDLIIAANVLHATQDLRQTIQHIQQLLAPNGILVLLEGTTRQRWLDLTFGLLEGWWRFNDLDIRPNYPLLPTREWQKLLKGSGFQQAVSIPQIQETNGILSEQAVILAQACNAPLSNTISDPKSWLILADQHGIAQHLAAQLRSQGDICTVAKPGNEFQQVSQEEFTVNPNNPSDLEQLLLGVQDDSHSLHGVIQCWSIDGIDIQTMSSEDLQNAQRLVCGTTLYLVQALVKLAQSKVPRLWLVTQGAQPIPNKNSYVSGIAQSSLWGMGKVIALEHPELKCVLVDLDPNAVVEKQAQALWEEICSEDAEDQVAIREQGRYVARLVRHHYNQDPDTKELLQLPQSQVSVDETSHKTLSFNEDATYLITGGLGGLGLLVARWMVKRGVRNLVLLGRSKAKDKVETQLRELEQSGAKVVIYKSDVSDFESIAQVMSEIEQSLPPLRGVIHSVGVLKDGILQQQTWENFTQVMAPKVQGAWNLHNLTLHKPLDFFVLFSSIASLLGSPGQANHSAANAFLDALAYYRQSLKLPGLSINWGVVAEIGAAAKIQTDERVKKMGIEAISPQQVLESLEILMDNHSGSVGVVPVRWSEYIRHSSDSPFFADLRETSHRKSLNQPIQPVKHDQLLEQLKAVSLREREKLLITYLQNEISQVLRANASQIDVQQPLNRMGLDSLMAVELRHRLQTDLAVNVPVVKFIENITIVDLVAEVNGLLFQIDRIQTVESENKEQTLLSDAKDSDWIEGEL